MKAADLATYLIAGMALVLGSLNIYDRVSSEPAPGSDREIENWSEVATGAHVLGPDDTAVTLVEFGDYECPFCRLAEERLSHVRAVFEGQVRFVYRHFPLPQHELAEAAAAFAICAERQGVFEAMHEFLYEGEELVSLDPELAASHVGVKDRDAFSACVRVPEALPELEADLGAAERAGVYRTPTLILNGVMLGSMPDSAQIRIRIQELMR